MAEFTKYAKWAGLAGLGLVVLGAVGLNFLPVKVLGTLLFAAGAVPAFLLAGKGKTLGLVVSGLAIAVLGGLAAVTSIPFVGAVVAGAVGMGAGLALGASAKEVKATFWK